MNILKEEITTVSNRLEQAESDNRESLKEIERHKHTNQQLQNQVSSLEKELNYRVTNKHQNEKMIQKLSNSYHKEEIRNLIK